MLHRLPLVRDIIEICNLLRKMSMDLQSLLAKVQAQTTVITSIDTMVKALAQQIRDNANDPEKLQALADALDANSVALGQVVTDGTPSQGAQ